MYAVLSERQHEPMCTYEEGHQAQVLGGWFNSLSGMKTIRLGHTRASWQQEPVGARTNGQAFQSGQLSVQESALSQNIGRM